MPHDDELPRPAEVLRAACAAFDAVVATLTEERSWLPTGCTGWVVRDLVVHCLGDAQRGLVALHTPVDQAPDRDAEVRRTLDRLLGRPAPPSWDDAHYARVATGRAPLSEDDRTHLGTDADRFPLFG